MQSSQFDSKTILFWWTHIVSCAVVGVVDVLSYGRHISLFVIDQTPFGIKELCEVRTA